LAAAVPHTGGDPSERERHLEALHEIAVASSGLLDPHTLGDLVVLKARDLLQGDEATLLWWDAAAGGLRVLADTHRRPFSRIIASGEGSAGIVYERGEPLLVEDYPRWEHAVPDAINRGMKSVLAVPLIVRQQPVGALTVSFNTQRPFTDEDLRIQMLLANQVAPALEAARLHDALVDMSEELQRASAAKSRFLASMSHELRTPLNAILGFVELLIDEPERGYGQAKRLQFLEQVHQSGKHLLALINDILDLAKAESGKMDLRLTRFDVVRTIMSAVDIVQPLANAKNLTLSAEVGSARGLVADEDKVKQILLNLLSNAIKFTPDGGSVTVTVADLPEEIQVCVADTGVGISGEDQQRLFVEFEQLVPKSGPRQQGTGLGLALIKRLAELHGGRAWVESEPGSGSRFFFALPKVTAKQEAVPDLPEPELTGGPLVMVIEDEESAATLLSINLVRSGYRVEIVRSGRDALARALSLKPDAITLDIRLPEPDGWDILRTLKGHPQTRKTPILVISVLDDRSLGFALGADDYLVKPVDRETLMNVLARYDFARSKGRATKILGVDDDPAALSLLRESLQPQFTVLTAGDGPQGIALARAERPDVVILDLMMPGMSGFEVAAALKADVETAQIPILVLTAKDLTDVEKARLNGHVASILLKGNGGTSELVDWLESHGVKRSS